MEFVTLENKYLWECFIQFYFKLWHLSYGRQFQNPSLGKNMYFDWCRVMFLQGEIVKVMEMGVDPSRIIFANPTKPASHIRHAAALGVDTMTVDNETELQKIKSLYPEAK